MSSATPWEDLQADQQARREILMGAYGRLFGGQGSAHDAAMVLGDLRTFCHVDRDMFTVEMAVMANRLGRFRVWQRIEGLRRGDPQDYQLPEREERLRRRSPLPPSEDGPAVREE